MRPRHVGSSTLLVVWAAVVLVSLSRPTSAQPPEQVRILIGFTHQPGPEEEALVHAEGGHIRYRYQLVPAMAVTVPETALAGLQQNPHVLAVEMDGLVQAIDAELDYAWGVERIGAGSAHTGGNKGAGVTVAIIDTGIDCTHPDLDGNCAGGVDFVNDDNDPMDDHGHGTHVAGTVAAEDDDSGVVGVAPEASLYALKVLSASGSGYWSDIIAAIEWAVIHGIHVTNNSYGGSADPGSIVKAAFDTAYASGVLHVAAAGNSGGCSGTGDTVIYPARFDSVIAVAATDSSDERACFSSTGAAVEIAAPGVYINSTHLGGGHVSMSGTSMASPHVAGTAALVFAAGAASNEEVRLRLRDTADELGAPERDPLYGFGLVDAAEAAAFGPVNQPPTVLITSPSNGDTFETEATIRFEGAANDPEDGDLTSELIWTSDIDGRIGQGGTCGGALSEGEHVVTAGATDSDGKTGSSAVTITVTRPPRMMSVDSITYTQQGGKNGDKHLNVALAVRDEADTPVEGAHLTASIRNLVSGSVWQETGTSRADGEVVLSIKNAPAGCYTTSVLSVTVDGLLWDGSSPMVSHCK